MKKAISLRIEEDLIKVLQQYAESENLSQANFIEAYLLTLKTGNKESIKPVEDTRQSITEEFILQILLPLKSRIEQLEEAIDYYDRALTPLIEEPTLLNLFKDEQTQEQLILFIERLKDTNASKTISIIPEALGSRS